MESSLVRGPGEARAKLAQTSCGSEAPQSGCLPWAQEGPPRPQLSTRASSTRS